MKIKIYQIDTARDKNRVKFKRICHPLFGSVTL